MNNSFKIKRVVGIGVLLALVIVFQLISNYVQFGPISITLALIPLAMGAILYGPIVGLILGLVMGALILTAPSTSLFLSFNIWYTILLCLLKTGLAGLISGLLFKLFIRLNFLKKAKLPLAIIISALICPIINTFTFILGISLMFKGADIGGGLIVSNDFATAFSSVYSAVITLNFLIEFLVSAILSPALVYLVKILAKQNNLGFQNDFYINTYNEENNIDSD